MPSVLHTASMIFRKFYDEYVTTKDPAMGEAGTRRVARLKIYVVCTAKKVVTERAARLWKDQKANPPIRCNAPTSASNTAQ